MVDPVKIAVAGAGMIGKRHVAAIAVSAGAALHSIVDPAASAPDYAHSCGVRCYPSLAALFNDDRPDGVILATPNQLHVQQGLQCVAVGIPALIEKPLATALDDARDLVAAGERAGISLLVGHHRRHNPIIIAAKERIASGQLGTLVAVHAMVWLMKPDDYFEEAWRRLPGAGPLFVNMVHDLDLLRYLVGEVRSVQAIKSNSMRGFDVEDTAAVILRFANGAVGTINISDTVVAPWSWELTANENPAYPFTGQSCYFIGGTHGSMELPGAKIWSNPQERGWWEPLSATYFPIETADPLVRQIDQFARVIRRDEAPLVPAREGLKTLEVIDAINRSAANGLPADVGIHSRS